MIASLPMYDRPETRAAWERLWDLTVQEHRQWRQNIRKDLPDIASNLTWGDDAEAHWLRPDLSFSQTCSLPYRTKLHGQVTLLGAFDFGLDGCPPGYYNSILVMRRDDPRRDTGAWADLSLAYNAPNSQSGWAAPFAHFQGLGITFNTGVQTGAHQASALSVAQGHADIAAIDAQTYRLLERYEPFMNQLVEVGRTDPTPGLPLITSRGWDANEFWGALDTAIQFLSPEDRQTLDLKGTTHIHPDRYMALPVPPAPPKSR